MPRMRKTPHILDQLQTMRRVHTDSRWRGLYILRGSLRHGYARHSTRAVRRRLRAAREDHDNYWFWERIGE